MDGDLKVFATDTLDRHAADLEALQAGVEKLARLSFAGSALEKAIGAVISILDSLKATPMQLGWKTVVKFLPPVATIYDAAVALRRSTAALAAPVAALRRQTPPVIASLREQQAGQPQPTAFSGQLYALLSAATELGNELPKLRELVGNTRRGAASVRGAGSNLSSVRAVGPVADKLCDAIAKLEASLGEMQATLDEVTALLARTLTWLPNDQRQSRQVVTAGADCQAVTKSSLFKKELCQKAVTSFDDEAPANCAICHIHVCAQHRVPVPAAPGSLTRNTWLCLECAAKRAK